MLFNIIQFILVKLIAHSKLDTLNILKHLCNKFWIQMKLIIYKIKIMNRKYLQYTIIRKHGNELVGITKIQFEHKSKYPQCSNSRRFGTPTSKLSFLFAF